MENIFFTGFGLEQFLGVWFLNQRNLSVQEILSSNWFLPIPISSEQNN
jgi:hypothetical protein